MNARLEQWKKACLGSDGTIQQAITTLNESCCKIVLIVTESGRFEGTVSDGDIRRALLKGAQMDSPILPVMNSDALVVPPDMSRAMMRQLMIANKIQQFPIVDEDHQVVGLHLWDEIHAQPERENAMVIMAGGMGTRLRPHTEKCPKPLLPVGGKPMLQHIIERANAEGLVNFVLAINYLGEMIEDYFGDGEKLGVNISYLRETQPLGTAGALSLLDPRPQLPFLITNGDVLTDIRYSELLDFHDRHATLATMAVRMFEWQNPFGVVQTEGIDIKGFEEKPLVRSYINAGVYVLSPKALNYMKTGQRCDMPNLFEKLQTESERTVAYPMHEPWMDVGRPEDYAQAMKMAA